MKVIRRYRDGDKIPDGATYLYTEYEKGEYLGSKEETIAYGWFYDRVRTTKTWERIPVLVYEEQEALPAAEQGGTA